MRVQSGCSSFVSLGYTNRWSGRVEDEVPSSEAGARAAQLSRSATVTTFRQRFSIMPDTVYVVVGMLGSSAIYLASSALLEALGLLHRLPLAPQPGLSICVSLANGLLAYSMFKAVGWVRPVVVVLPLVAYPFEHGFGLPAHWSQSGFDLLASALVLPACAIYCLYINRCASDWFRSSGSRSPNTSRERTRDR
jgi:hypothetical protein